MFCLYPKLHSKRLRMFLVAPRCAISLRLPMLLFKNWQSKGVRVVVDDVPAVSRDPKDDIFLACADVRRADTIISEDNDLLVLNPYKSIQIVNVSDFLKLLK